MPRSSMDLERRSPKAKVTSSTLVGTTKNGENMELHHKIIEVLKQEFPALVLPEIQEGFVIGIMVSIERLTPDALNPVKYMDFSYSSATGEFTYIPILGETGMGTGTSTTAEDFQSEIQWAKEHGPFTVNASVSHSGPVITVCGRTCVNVNNNFIQETFLDDEIELALSRANDKFGVEVSDDKSKIKVYPKDKNSLDDPLLLTVEHHIKFPKDRMWHAELLTDIPNIGPDPHNDPSNHVRWAGIPFSAMLDKMFDLYEDDGYTVIPAAGNPR